jgi:hypothetical protein
MPQLIHSYIIDVPTVQGEWVNDSPRGWRQHLVEDVSQPGVVMEQIIRERGNVPVGSVIEWWSGSVQ